LGIIARYGGGEQADQVMADLRRETMIDLAEVAALEFHTGILARPGRAIFLR
jgi:hypothetical protein